MKFKSSTTICFLLLSFISTVAQVNDTTLSKVLPFTNEKSILKIILESDSSTKSVFVSNLKVDKAGDMSPVIGAANWMDNGKELLCRSLLEFNYNLIPVEILDNPLLILQAELVLYPIHAEFAVNDNAKTSIIHIRQVLDKWEDSSTTWNSQPKTNFENQSSVTIETKNKDIPASTDVTDIVLNNIIKGKNNGFMIVPDENRNTSFSAGQLFASPKNENPGIRPQLVLYVAYQQDMKHTQSASKIKPVDNLLNELYLKRNTLYYDPNNPGKYSIYQMNLRTGTVPENLPRRIRQ
ncbi:MAG: DNRLRE domain-containing protein [Chitinophagaceae bacterium]|nr:DNRLRE domain-containing protein [Chitinophagaceae bacterium]